MHIGWPKRKLAVLQLHWHASACASALIALNNQLYGSTARLVPISPSVGDSLDEWHRNVPVLVHLHPP